LQSQPRQQPVHARRHNTTIVATSRRRRLRTCPLPSLPPTHGQRFNVFNNNSHRINRVISQIICHVCTFFYDIITIIIIIIIIITLSYYIWLTMIQYNDNHCQVNRKLICASIILSIDFDLRASGRGSQSLRWNYIWWRLYSHVFVLTVSMLFDMYKLNLTNIIE